ncbi:MAG: methylated-DNA--[protein]-cysteine S-methyltransferase [Granulosicoccus sp.]
MIPLLPTRYHARFEKTGKTLQTTAYQSPIGTLTLAADEHGLRHIIFPQGSRSFSPPDSWQQTSHGFKETINQLDEYFSGTRKTFTIKLSPHGTDFQRSVWLALLQVGYGQTTSYGDIAKLIGKPKASRAVGAANGANPIPIIIPCHRIVGSAGKLTGFGGGLPTKQWLLAHERGDGQLFDFTNP